MFVCKEGDLCSREYKNTKICPVPTIVISGLISISDNEPLHQVSNVEIKTC